MEAFFEEGTKGTDKRPSALAQRDKLKATLGPTHHFSALSLCEDTLGRRKWVRPRSYPEPGGVGG